MKRLYTNHRTSERTESASQALQWYRQGDDIDILDGNERGYIYDTLRMIKGAKVETERERFDRVEGRERCQAISEELNAYHDGNMHRCPECGETVKVPDDVGDKFRCYHCETANDLTDYEQLNIYDYMDDILDIDFTVNRHKEYQSCSICVGWGGPNIFIDTADAYVKLYWGSTQEQFPIHYETCDDIDEWAMEYYNNI